MIVMKTANPAIAALYAEVTELTTMIGENRRLHKLAQNRVRQPDYCIAFRSGEGVDRVCCAAAANGNISVQKMKMIAVNRRIRKLNPREFSMGKH